MNRRSFLIRTTGLLALISLALFFSFKDIRSFLRHLFTSAPPDGFSERDWQTLKAIQEHLFPSEPDAPGAKDINALEYFHFVLSHEITDERERGQIQRGLMEIDTIAQEMANQPFVLLSEKQREAVLRRFEKTANGKEWLTMTLNNIFEALLGDPVYGGNPNGIGWKWLGHRPGLPRPLMGKRYYEL
jgi:gluconate 2-dehydrogenase gamma chain